MTKMTSSKELFRQILDSEESALDERLMRQYGLEILPLLYDHLSRESSIVKLEKIERIFKSVIKHAIGCGIDAEEALKIARMQRNCGFTLKHKSYSIKASHPFGYSIFLHNPHQGFSFQEHVSHKIELFHILHVLDGAFVFVCSSEEWVSFYHPDAFQRWLEGESNWRYDQFCYRPEPGDVIGIDTLRTVHTVFGCILEEYATTSEDMVVRLHDQNLDRPIPEYFARPFAFSVLASIAPTRSNARVRIGEGSAQRELFEPRRENGGATSTLLRHPFLAERHFVFSGLSRLERVEKGFVTSLYVFSGEGLLSVDGKGHPDKEAIRLYPGSLLSLIGGFTYRISNTGAGEMVISKQCIHSDLVV